jgi:serine/threonine-protein kinase
MAMEYIDGRDLGQVLRRCRERKISLPIDFAVFLGVTLLDALAYAHRAKTPTGKELAIVHCDISPSNLFISRVGEIKLGDFGIARVTHERLEPGQAVWGKAYYLSPEALAGRIDSHADLWAATTTVYELLTNERPFTGPKPEDVLEAIKRAKPKRVRERRPEVSEALDELVMRGFSKDLAQRYPDAGAYAEALRPHYNELIGTPLAIAAVVRGLFGA